LPLVRDRETMGALCCCLKGGSKAPVSAKEQADSVLVRFGADHGKTVKVGDYTVSGTGTALANTTLMQDRTYFEMTVESPGTFAVGVTHDRKTALEHQLTDRPGTHSLSSSQHSFAGGDVIGCYYDLSGVRTVLSFTVNGVAVPNATVSNIKGDVWPAVSVGDGAALSANFGQRTWTHAPTHGFVAPLMARDTM